MREFCTYLLVYSRTFVSSMEIAIKNGWILQVTRCRCRNRKYLSKTYICSIIEHICRLREEPE